MRNNTILLGRRYSDSEKADSELSGKGTWTIPDYQQGKFYIPNN